MATLWSFVGKISSAAEHVARELAYIPEEEAEENSGEAYSKEGEDIDISLLMNSESTLAFPEIGKGMEESLKTSHLTLRNDLSSMRDQATSSVARSAEAAGGFFKNIVSTLKPHISGVPSLLYSTLFSNSAFLHKITEQLYIMDFPEPLIIEELSQTLDSLFPSHYMILNMSERRYDTEQYFLLGQCVEIHYKGLPAPPVLVQLLLCMQAYTWLTADSGNILVVHCFHGHGRSAVFLACFMAWNGFFDHPLKALRTICKSLGLSDDFLGHILPSQRRYLGYFDVIMNGYSPHCLKLTLKRISFYGISFSDWEKNETENEEISVESIKRCNPILEIWQEGQIFYSSENASMDTFIIDEPSEMSNEGNFIDKTNSLVSTELKSFSNTHSISFPTGIEIYGDVLIRLRLSDFHKQLHSIIRAAFHTGFLTDNFLRLKKHELDGIAVDSRFSSSCYLDIQFESSANEDSEKLDEQTQIIAQARRDANEAHDGTIGYVASTVVFVLSALRRNEGWTEETHTAVMEEGKEMQPMVYLLTDTAPEEEKLPNSHSSVESISKERKEKPREGKITLSEELNPPEILETPSLISVLDTVSVPTLVRSLPEETKDESEDEGWGDEVVTESVSSLLKTPSPLPAEEMKNEEDEEDEEEDEFAIAWDINEIPPLQPWQPVEAEEPKNAES
ncbi:putative Tensin-3 [Cardiosporidium cionae]|uniref:Tensin-3 n=1 Tax=Cardiosporidium cionae TaxID=476202 RepID=A0ABQ7J9W4_9APIC|nr:putative Tensin-3 [Cardiosporidium cionae]|eukprot:KAF8820759.1 putative Tensin-3 [Cardiosporidium cionae]